MTSAVQVPRPIGRPRVFTDDDVFRATARAIAHLGYTDLTLAAVAAELGCSPPALIKRFGSKKGLALAYLTWANHESRERFARIRESADSPLQALRTRVRIPTADRLDEVADQEGYANFVAFTLAARNDPELTGAMRERRQLFYDEIERLVIDAIETGELRECDPTVVSRAMLSGLTGSALNWVLDIDWTIEDRLAQAVEDVLRPYIANVS